MDLNELRQNWNQFGETDPLWAILTGPDKRYGGWDPEEFFAEGRHEIAAVVDLVTEGAAKHGRELRRGRALDFGCGVGRLTQALADHFESVDGVDIAKSMIEQARQWNRRGDWCRFHLNEVDDLSLFPDAHFDFIYTSHVLQHMAVDYQERYVKEFLRVLAPSGLALFEMVSRTVVGATEPLPDDAFRVAIEVLEAPHQLTATTPALVRLAVRNVGARVLPAAGKDGWLMVTVGNHWLDRHGNRAIYDDGRSYLPADLQPGDRVEVTVPIRAPREAGRYRLEFDCIQEGVAWFSDRGSQTTKADVTVIARRRRGRDLLRRMRSVPAASTSPEEKEAVMEMHGVPEDVVHGWVEVAGGVLLDRYEFCDVVHMEASLDWERPTYLVARNT